MTAESTRLADPTVRGRSPHTSARLSTADVRVRYVVYRYGHHSPHSGYSRLPEFAARHFDSETIRVGRPLSRRLVRERLLWRLAAGTPGYDRASMAAELAVARRVLSERRCVYHFLYGETTYRHVGALNNVRDNRLVATFHQPPAQIGRAVQVDHHLRRLSAVVCVGRNQLDFFRGVLPEDRLFFVPLGVDTDYFTPPAAPVGRDPDLCLCVGENYRDFPTLRGVVELIAYRRPRTRFVVVGSDRIRERLGAHPRLTLRSGVSEPEFRELYRTAAVQLMPLTDATANNALLEGMACGLPVVVSDVGAIRDYLPSDSGALVPAGDAGAMADAALDLLDDPGRAARLSAATRRASLSLAWPEVTRRLGAVYDAVA